MIPLKTVPVRNYLSAFLIFFILGTFAFSTRWLSGRKMLTEVLWDPIPLQLLYPADKLVSDALKQGKLALWDPYRGFGSSLVMPSSFTIAHPLKLLAFLWGTDAGFEFVLLFRLVLAGFFAYLLGRALNFSHLSGLLTGVGYMFCGYFRQFHNFMDLNVSMFYPLVFLLLLRIFQKPKILELILTLLVGYFMISGGHPEAFYAVAGLVIFVGFYSLLEQIFPWPKNLISVIVPRVFFLFFLLLIFYPTHFMFEPGVEVFLQGWSYHMPGLGKLHFDILHLIALFTPVFDLWLKAPRGLGPSLFQFTIIPSYLGFFLSSLALFSLCNLKHSSRMLGFFWLLTIVLLGLLFGIPGFNWLVSLPFINRLQNFRYLQPLLAISVSVLAGFGLEQIQKKQNTKIYILLLTVESFWLLIHFFTFKHYLLANLVFLWAGLLCVASPVLLILLYLAFWQKEPLRLARALLELSIAELFCYFILISPFYGRETFQLKKPSFLERIKLESNLYRIYSPEPALIPPDNASLFKLRDVRERGPLYPKKYFHFISALNGWESIEEVRADFLQQGTFYLPLKLEKIPESTQDLIFGYLILNQRLGALSLLKQTPSGIFIGRAPNYFAQASFELKDKSRNAVLLHPPARLKFAEAVSSGQLVFEIGIYFRKNSLQTKTDGAEFLITGLSGKGPVLKFYRYLSAEEAQEQGWREYRFWISEQMFMELKSLGGPRGKNLQDFALFGSVEFIKEPGTNYELLDDSGPFLYQRFSRVPRFFLSHQVEWLPSSEQVLQKIREGKLSGGKVYLSGFLLDSTTLEGSEEKDSSGRIHLLRDETDLIELEVSSSKPSWLIILDAYFPGWRAFLDQKEQRIYPANYLFRAIHLPAGKHHLKLVYHPFSFRIGLYKNLAFFLCCFFLTGLFLFRKKSWAHHFFP